MESRPMDDYTSGAFLNGRLHIRQPASGYRFSIDSVILANLCRIKPGDRVIDLGTGCGIISLIMALRKPSVSRIFGIDIQARMVEIAQYNVKQNRLDDRIDIIQADLKSITTENTGGLVDLVVCNPPHYKPRSGRINPDSQRAIARHEISMTIDDLMSAARRMIGYGGRICIVYPSERLVDLTSGMRKADIEPKSIRMIHPRPGDGAKLLVAEGIAGKRPSVRISHPLYIHDAFGGYSSEIRTMLNGPVDTVNAGNIESSAINN